MGLAFLVYFACIGLGFIGFIICLIVSIKFLRGPVASSAWAKIQG